MAVLAGKSTKLIILLFILLTIYIQFYGKIENKIFVVPASSHTNFDISDLSETLTSKAEAYLSRPLIFIVGAQSSGTSLTRLILDVHPEVNCGDETSVTYRVANFVVQHIFNVNWSVRFLADFGVKNETVEKAAALFIYYMMENNKKNLEFDITKAKYLCNKGSMLRVFFLTKFISFITYIWK